VKRVFVAMLTAVLLCSTAFSRTQDKKSETAGTPERQVMALNRAWAEAITKGDAAALERLFADDMIVTAGNGELRDKAKEIKDAASSPDPDFVWVQPFTTEDVRVKIYKDAAVVTGRARWAFKYKGQESNHDRRYTHLYVKQQGRWKIVAQQMSANLFKKPQSSQ
jgi:uncharacterized protein (TIGR02246 family)